MAGLLPSKKCWADWNYRLFHHLKASFYHICHEKILHYQSKENYNTHKQTIRESIVDMIFMVDVKVKNCMAPENAALGFLLETIIFRVQVCFRGVSALLSVSLVCDEVFKGILRLFDNLLCFCQVFFLKFLVRRTHELMPKSFPHQFINWALRVVYRDHPQSNGAQGRTIGRWLPSVKCPVCFLGGIILE